MPDVLLQPGMCGYIVGVRLVQKRDEHIDVEKRTHAACG